MADPNKSSCCRQPLKRGRPSKQRVEELIRDANSHEIQPGEEGKRCPVCKRVLPRNKSLTAHLKTHTGETPYSCTYPGCVRSFKQSGQLKTHFRVHTFERPYVCPFAGCTKRYAHSNRRCTVHGQEVIKDGQRRFDYSEWNKLSNEELQWCRNYEEKENSRLKKENHSKRFRYASGSSGYAEGSSRSQTPNEQSVLQEDGGSQWNKENVCSNLPSVGPDSPDSSISDSPASSQYTSGTDESRPSSNECRISPDVFEVSQRSSGYAEENSRSSSPNVQTFPLHHEALQLSIENVSNNLPSEGSRSPSTSSAYSSASPEYVSGSDESRPLPTIYSLSDIECAFTMAFLLPNAE